jgi:hypothetical protein
MYSDRIRCWVEDREDEFCSYVEQNAARHVSPTDTTLEELALAFGCAHGNPLAIVEFRDRIVRRLGANFDDESKQALLAHLLVPEEGRPARVLQFSGRRSLVTWVRRIARNLVVSWRRTTESNGVEAHEDVLASTETPDVLLERSEHSRMFAGRSAKLSELSRRATGRS